MPKQSAARRIKKAVRKKLGPKIEDRKEGLLKRTVRRYAGPKQAGLKPAFKDGFVFHSHVRVVKRGPKSKTFPKGNPTATVVTKFRTMKRGAYKDFEKRGRAPKEEKTLIGKALRWTHLDELPQVISILKGDMKPVAIRALPKNLYRDLPEELRKFYDEVGPGAIGLQHCCKSEKPTYKEFMEVVREFHKIWKENPKRAYLIYGLKFLKNYKAGERPIEEIIKRQ